MVHASHRENIVIAKIRLLNVHAACAMMLMGLGASPACGQVKIPGWVTGEIVFDAPASGGTLVFSDMVNVNPISAQIDTQPGESPESVAKRLAHAINWEWVQYGWRIDTVQSSGSMLYRIPGGIDYSLAGTETGLGIPKPPHSLTAIYDPTIDGFRLKWENGDNYEHIRYSNSGYPGNAPTSATSHVISQVSARRTGTMFRGADDFYFVVCGIKNGIPSASAAIRANKCVQCESTGYRSDEGLLSNWRSWSADGDRKAVRARVGEKAGKKTSGMPDCQVESQYPIFQAVSTSKPGVKCGVVRKFVGLSAGSRYCVDAFTSVPASGPFAQNAHYELFAAPAHDLDEASLSKLGEPAALQAKGKLGEVRLLDSSSSPSLSGKGWKSVAPGLGKLASDPVITLPEGFDEIVVWAVCQNIPQEQEIGIDWLTLKDLTCEAEIARLQNQPAPQTGAK